jgi:chaperonin GroES
MKIQPLGNRVLVRRSKVKTTKGGILLPDSAQEKPKEGEVIAVGEGEVLENGEKRVLSLRVGDRVLFSSYAGTEVKSHDLEEELLILNEDDVLGVLS